jgi:hypothetical protein
VTRAGDFHCAFLGRRADHLHHVTGTDADGVYLDPLLVVPISAPQHDIEHVGWRALGIGEGAALPPDTLRLLRISHLFIRLGDVDTPTGVLPTIFLRELGRTLQRVAGEREVNG